MEGPVITREMGGTMGRDVQAVERDLERARGLREALALELETAVGRPREDRLVAYRRMCETCRRLAEEVERGYGAE